MLDVNMPAEVAQLFFGFEINIFTKQSEVIGIFQNFVKQAACFFFMAGYKQCPYKPECTNRKSRSRQPKSSLLL